MSNMTSYKRKRIEKWCEEVALYLRNGTICRSVIGHVVEDTLNHAENTNENGENLPNNNGQSGTPSGRNQNTPSGLNSKVDLALKKASEALSPRNGYVNSKDVGLNGQGGGDSTFPMVKFAYSHYHEQRRKIDRLVQGLPVLNANGLSTMDRPPSKASTDEHVPIIFVNGEEPVRLSQARSRSSSQPRHHHHHHHHHHHFSHAHIVSGSHGNIHQLHAPHTARHLAAPFRSPGTARGNSGDNVRQNANGASKLYDGKVPPVQKHVTVMVDPGIKLTANDRVARSKTAPAPNRNVHRARQRILSRRNTRAFDHTSQIPPQNCWAMAELTW